jgi:recombination protein RecA
VLPTGFAALDAALGGGIPRGRIMEVFGPESCGKTTLALRIVAHLQANRFTAGWIDADHCFDAGYATALGVSMERLIVVRPASAEDALEIARRLAATSAVDLLIIDSAAALVPSLELSGRIGEGGQGLQARVLASEVRKLAVEVARPGAAALFLNQTRGRPGAPDEETTAGGPALKLHAAVRLALRLGQDGRLRFRMLKNKAAAAFVEGELDWPPAR